MNKNAIALIIIWMIVMLPIVEAQALGGETSTALFVNATIARYPRTTKIDIAGTTKSGATVTITVNGADVKKDIIADGTFFFKNVPLQMINTIVVKAELGSESTSQTYQSDVDSTPPLMNVTVGHVVTTSSATAKVKVSEPVNLTVQVGNETNKSFSLNAGSTDVKVDLQPGENMVDFTAIDKAGLKSFTEERVVYDTGPPRFEKTNLNQLSPTYSQEINVKGKLSEQGSVTAFVNGRPQKTVATDPDGSFSIKVKLERPFAVNSSGERVTGQAVSLDQGIQWKNKIRLEAVDAAGLKTSTDEVEIAYALCGSGTWIDVVLTDPMPDIANPRLLIEGIQQVGIAFNYTYRGGAKADIDARSIRIRPLILSPEVRNEYDNSLVTVRAPNVRAQRSTKPSGVGYIQVNFNPIQDPWSLPEKGKKPEPGPANATMFSREERVSLHREGDCIAPGLGCMKLFLELEIPFTETTMKMTYDPNVQRTLEKEVVEPMTQRTCIDISLAIDKRVPPDILPSNMLRAVSKTLGNIVETIDKVLKPIQTIGKYLFYTCVAGQFLSIVPIFLEKYNCEFKKVTDILSGGQGAFDPTIAAINACDAEYGSGTDSANNCNTCSHWKDYRKRFVRTYRQVCDRVMCPAAPSLQYYLKTRGRESPTEVKAKQAMQELNSYLVNGKLLAGSDCAAWINKNKKSEERGTKKAVLPPRLFFTTQEIQSIYSDWLKHQSDTASEASASQGVNCAGLHPAIPECCGYEYMQEWSSACGVSALGQGLDTFDEIKESTCLAAQKAGKNEIAGTEGPVQCNRLLNSVSGFCEKNGMPPLTPVRVTTISASQAEVLELQKYAESNDLYIIVQDKGKPSSVLGIVPTGQSQGYSVKLGLIIKTLEFQRSDKPEILATSERSKLTEKLDVIEYPGYTAFQQEYFSQEKIDAYRQTGAIPPNFKSTLCEAAGKSAGIGFGKCTIDEKYIYGQVIQAFGAPDKEYIIKPSDGLINSVRCLCFPTLVGYLKQWRNIMSAVKNCVDTILFTGDGENGVCQAVISQYVCDLLYDVLTCFTQQFSTGQGRVGSEGGGDVMGALVASGSEMSREVEGRYGETGLYKAVFVDKKLVHSICMFAFTGTWDFNLGAIYDQSVDSIPLNSQALLTPCNRRFVAFNPSTRPGGLVTWVYHFGSFIAAGADIESELHLVCSDDFSCKESDGYENGKCDCQGKGKKDAVIRPENLPPRIKKNQIVSEEIFYTMQAGSGESNIRYDKAYLLYRWKEANKQMREEKTEPCSVSLTGGTGSVPAFCRFDPFTISFRCMFGEAAGGLRFRGNNILYPHTIPHGQTFALSENLNVELQLQQDYPGGDQYNKYLEYNITSALGRPLESNKDRGLILLQTNGDYNKRIAADGTPPIPIEVMRTWFDTTEAGKPFVVKQWAKLTTSATGTLAPNKIVDNAQLSGLAGVVTDRTEFVLELTRQGDKIQYSVYTAGRNDAPGGGEKGGFVVAPPAACTGIVSGNRITCTPPTITPRPGEAPKPQNTLTITIKPDFTAPASDEIIQSYIDLNIPAVTGGDPCKVDIKDRPLQNFKMKLAVYDADKYGQPSEQVSVDPYTGAEARYEISFNAICATKDELKPLEGILGPAEILAGLSKDVKAMVEPEQKYKTALEGFVSQPLKIEQVTTIQNQLDQIIFGETDKATVLDKYRTNLKNMTQLETVKTAVDELYNIIRPPYHAELELPNNVVMAATDAKNAISREVQGTPNVLRMQDALRAVIPILQNALDSKQRLLTLLPAVAGEKGTCQTGQTIAGSYYECAPEGQTRGDPWNIESDKVCYGTVKQTCYRLNAENLCIGKDTQGNAYHCDKMCTGNSLVSPDQTRICRPTEDQTCCMVKSTELQKLLNLKNGITLFVGSAKGAQTTFAGMSKKSDEETINLMFASDGGTPPLISELESTISSLKPQQTVLQNLATQPVPQEVLDLISETTTAITDITTARSDILQNNKPTVIDIKKTIDTTVSALNGLSYRGGVAIAVIDKLLGIAPAQTAAPQIQPETAPPAAAPAEAPAAQPPTTMPLSINGKTDLAIVAKGTDIQIKIVLPKNVQAFEYVELFAYKNNVHIATWDVRSGYNPSTGEVTFTLRADQYSNFATGETYVFDMAYSPPHTVGNKVNVKTFVPPCGDGKIDPGEVCDRASDGTVIVPSTDDERIGYDAGTDRVTWYSHVTALPKDYDVTYGWMSTKGFCSEVVGIDCDDKVEYSAEKGYCSGDCKRFMPRVTCVDDDIIGDSGRAAYLTPEFTYEGTKRTMNKAYWYLFSDPKAGNNGCYPTSPVPGTAPYNPNWQETPVSIDYPPFATKPVPFQPPTAQP